MNQPLSPLTARVNAEPASLDVDIFLSYLKYRYCKEDSRMMRDEAYIINTKNSATSSVPIRYRMLDKEMIYWICRELGVNMPDEFSAYQEMMDGLPE